MCVADVLLVLLKAHIKSQVEIQQRIVSYVLYLHPIARFPLFITLHCLFVVRVVFFSPITLLVIARTGLFKSRV
jgi:hypothetical protein